MIKVQACYRALCDVCQRPAGPWRWSAEQAREDALAQRWACGVCQACLQAPVTQRPADRMPPLSASWTGD